MSDIQNAPDPKRSILDRVLLGAIIAMGVLIVLALAALIYGVLSGWSKHNTAVATFDNTSLLQNFPKDARILDMKVDQGRTVVRLRTGKGEEIDIYDSATGRLVARIAPPEK